MRAVAVSLVVPPPITRISLQQSIVVRLRDEEGNERN
jgi:hypothetical protein